LIRAKTMVSWTTLSGFAAALLVGASLVGCDTSGSSPQAIKAPPVEGGTTNAPLPKDPKRGGGPASSGNMKRHPGDSF
jgi:hypothetical protein